MKAILVDDERLALDYLEHQLARNENVEVIGKFLDPLAVLDKISIEDVDVVFMDINLPEISGIELAERLLERRPSLHVVFITAYDDYAVKAFELNALDYIVKPVEPERLSKTIRRVRERLEETRALMQTADQPLRLHVFRQALIESPGDKPTVMHWRTSKAQELFLYLLQHHDQLVRKSVLIELLWPDHEPNKVYPQLYTAIYHTRKTLEPYGDRFQITNTSEGYMMHLSNVVLDAEEWENQVLTAPPLHSGTIDEYKALLQRYTGDYLQEYDYWWAEGERHRLKMVWLRLATQIAEWCQANNQPQEAIEVYSQICERHPQAEEAYFALMKLYASLGQHLSVKRQYALLKEALAEELYEEPSPYIVEWYKKWKAGK